MITGYLGFFIFLALKSAMTGRAALFGDFDDLPHTSYDFIIVGGGTAGNVVANRLTENPGVSVLVLEAGGSNKGATNTIVPFFCTEASPNTLYDWNFTTTPQSGLDGRTLGYPRGHILGGSSSINYMVYTRGSSSDWDRYAALTGDKGWGWDKIQVYLRKNELWTSPPDNHDTSRQFDPQFHSTSGINSVSLSGFPHSGIDHRVIQTTQQLGEEFPFNQDMNSGNHLGVGFIQNTVNKGRRSSSATSYLASKFIHRPNLHVLTGARATRLSKTARGPGKPQFRVVEFQSATGQQVTLTASKEVILSAGAVGTPQLLLLSGIGDPKSLKALNITSTVNLPDVGRNLSDHSVLGLVWLVNSTDTFETARRNATLSAAQFAQWNATETGPLVDTPLDYLAWLRLPGNSSIFKKFQDPAAGANTAHFELMFANGLITSNPPPGNFMSILAAVVSPASRGSITLATNNPFDQPNIDPNLLGSDLDILIMREAVRSANRFIAAPTWKDYIIAPFAVPEDNSSDAQLDIYIRKNAATIFHPVGTASMSPKGASYGVVDPDLLVKGVSGLRVVDVSVLPIIPAAHTQAATYVVAERAADLVKQHWKF